MTVDREIEEIINAFNPSTDVSARSLSALQSYPEHKGLWITLKSGSDDFFYKALVSSVLAIFDIVKKGEAETSNHREKDTIFATHILIGMAARDRAFSRSGIQRIERDYAVYMPFSDVLWRELELFRAVCRLTDALGVRRPEFLQDERRTWGQLFLRKFSRSIRTNTQTSILLPAHLKNKSLRKVQKSSAPLTRSDENIIIDYALHLADWDDSDVKLSHLASRDRAHLRKDIRQKLENYETALKVLKTYSTDIPPFQLAHRTIKRSNRDHGHFL